MTNPAAAPRRRRFARPVSVSVNGVAVASAEISRETQHHQASDPDQAWELAAKALTIRELLSQEADRLGIVAAPIEDEEGRAETPQEARYRQVIEREVIVPSADEDTCRGYYERNRQRFRTPDLCEAAHILLAAAPEDEAARELAREAASALIAALRERPQDFAAAAAEHSACPSAGQGGSLGQLSPGQTVAEFDTALRGMTPGAVHAVPVETRFGFHVVRLDRRIEGRQLPFEMVRQRIADYLDEMVRRRALQQYVSVLAGRAVVTGVDLAPAAGPLVQ
jgi:peptidyl-prolyl cis-trans isomerase C